MSVIDVPPPAPSELDGPATPGRASKQQRVRKRGGLKPEVGLLRPLLVDMLAVLALTVLALTAFAPTYGGLQWLVVGLVGAVGSLAVVYVLTQLRINPVIGLGVVLLAFFLFGGVAVPGDAIAGLLPGPSTPAALLDGLLHGWSRSLTTVVPTGIGSGLGVLPYVCGFVAAGAGYLFARMTKLSVVPAVPPLVALLLAILMGTSRPGSVLLQGACFAVVVIAWGSYRAAKARANQVSTHALRVGRGVTVAAYLAVVVAGALLIGPDLPLASHSDRYVLRAHKVPPFDPRQYPSPLAGFRSYRLEAGGTRDQSLVTVSGLPKGALLRTATMDGYDGIVFVVGGSGNPAAQPSGSGRFDKVGSGQADPAASGPGKDVTIAVKIPKGAAPSIWVPLTGALKTIDFTGPRASALTQSFRYNAVSHMGAVPVELRPGDGYRAVVRVLDQQTGESLKTAPGVKKLDRSIALADEPTLPSELDATARKLMGSSADPLAKALAVEAAFKSDGRYSDGEDNGVIVLPGHSIANIMKFLGTNPTVGDDEQYAAAMALLLRSQGLPARVAMGFTSSGKPNETYKGSDLHAWVEVPFEGRGWVAFYPTPTRKPDQQPEQKPREVQTDVQAAPPTTYLQVPPPDLSQNRKRRDDAKSGGGFEIPGFVILAAKVLGTPLVLFVALVGLMAGLKGLRMRRRRTRGSAVERLGGAWAEMIDRLLDLGVRTQRSSTRSELASAVPVALWSGAHDFAAQLDGAMFGREEPDDELVQQVWRQVDEGVKAIRPSSPKERLRALLNPTSLLRRRR